jgi:serine/threonine protein phosphatase 1
MKRYAIGDIHGGSQTFKALLDSLSIRHQDQLYLLGDYVDRGNDSKGVLDTILQLKNAGYDVKPVRGNHDDMMLRTFTQDHDEYSWYWMKGWGQRTLESFEVGKIVQMKSIYLTLLDSLPYVRFDDDYVFVHAALDMRKDDPITESDTTGMMWEKIGDIDPQRLGGRKLVTGHRIRTMPSIIASLATNHIELDNGAYSDLDPSIGSLVALNLDTMELTAQRWLDGEALG